MANTGDDFGAHSGLNTGRVVAAAMTVSGFLFGILATVWLVARIFELSRREEPPPTLAEFAGVAALFLGAWALAALLWGMAQILRRLEDRAVSRREAGAGGRVDSGPLSAGAAAATEKQARRLEELTVLMRDLRDIALLSDHERTMRARVESSALAHQLEHDVPALLREHRWHEAQRRVQLARARFPSVPAWDRLAELVEQARAQFEAHDIEAATRDIEDLSALCAWDRALAVAHELRQRHPDSQKVREFVERVGQRLNKAANEERTRLMAKAQEATDLRKWQEALRLVEMVVQKYPKSPEARDLRHQLPTLRANAEIQHRQQMEHEIQDLMKQQRSAEALRMARELIGRYPDSPQANVLRTLLPKLEQKAGESW